MSPNPNPYPQQQQQAQTQTYDPTAYQQPAQPAQQYAYPAQAQYAPQPQYAAQPGYYGQPYYPVAYAPPQDHTSSTIAGVMWILCLVRDVLYLIAFLALGSILGGFGGFGFGGIIAVMAIFPLIGVIGSAVAMSSDFSRKNYNSGTIGAVMALIGSTFPGIILIGPVGLILAIIGLVLHVQAKPTFTS